MGQANVVRWVGECKNVLISAYWKTFDGSEIRIIQLLTQSLCEVCPAIVVTCEGLPKAIHRLARRRVRRSKGYLSWLDVLSGHLAPAFRFHRLRVPSRSLSAPLPYCRPARLLDVYCPCHNPAYAHSNKRRGGGTESASVQGKPPFSSAASKDATSIRTMRKPRSAWFAASTKCAGKGAVSIARLGGQVRLNWPPLGHRHVLTASPRRLALQVRPQRCIPLLQQVNRVARLTVASDLRPRFRRATCAGRKWQRGHSGVASSSWEWKSRHHAQVDGMHRAGG